MQPGVLVISHGSADLLWIKQVDKVVSELKLPPGVPVEASFLEAVEGRLIQDGIDRLEARGVTDLIVIPLFVSSGSTHIDEIAYALGVKHRPDKETDLVPFKIKARVYFGEPIDDDSLIAVMIGDKARPMSDGGRNEMLLLVGHGSIHDGFRERWQQGIASLANHVKELSGFSFADYALLNPDSLRSKVELWQGRGCEVIVVPVFLSPGYFTKKVIPARLEGLSYRYTGETLLPHPLLRDWIQLQISHIMGSLTME
ncbi:cobalamin biosynthesis protein CbiX [Paenibacillus sp. CAA11]|uniref:sirohydrochlorin chelatase n=1 Tax=Paenibacillus sp. CAA11 TaxID=1532905 RepID=UPI000D36FFF4|nr:CbiX/SirB N-terminal domain-containing protein [Paenibacillus sp. CAA11]AWB43412.1 cobalamin biosynthesis protein CbiX [Paenibacillus sp. CAA11]